MLKAISLFSGAGGCSLGFEKTSKYQLLAAYDNNKYAVDTYNANFSSGIAKEVDLANCDFSKIRDELNLNIGELDIILGGPPCQGFSSAGSRFWDDPRNSLIRNYIQALKEFYPKWFFMENVEGILTTARGEYIIEAVNRFIELGYSIILEKIYSQEFGIPQRRKRVIIVGTRVNSKLSFPTPKFPIGGPIFRNSPNTLRHAIEDLEDVNIPEIDHNPKKETGANIKRIKYLKQGQSMKDLPTELQHESFHKRANRRVMDGTPSEKRGGAPTGLKRLIYDEPSLTITSASIREFIHPIKDRPLTIRECARIQTFPDSFNFKGSEAEKIKQIGNAIPPVLAQIFAEHIYFLNSLNGYNNRKGLISFSLTKAEAMSPALENTCKKLSALCSEQQGDLFHGII